jgi:hypothetical protein
MFRIISCKGNSGYHYLVNIKYEVLFLRQLKPSHKWERIPDSWNIRDRTVRRDNVKCVIRKLYNIDHIIGDNFEELL